MDVLAFSGSPRANGNSTIMLRHLLQGVRDAGGVAEVLRTDELDLKPCRGCLRCNLLKRCAVAGDDWPEVSRKILSAKALVFASPVYFHHVSASMKKLLDRFRSFIHVQITEDGLQHTPWHEWRKPFVLLMSMGSPDAAEAGPVHDLFSFVTGVLGAGNALQVFSGTRLAVARQVEMDRQQLAAVYEKLQLPGALAERDCERNRELLNRCYRCGRELAGAKPA